MDRAVQHRPRGIAAPLVLIAFGLALLASNLGYLSWNGWDLAFRLWPLLIMAIGLDVILGRGSAAGVGAIVGTLALVAVLIGVAATGTWLIAPSAVTDTSFETSDTLLGGAVSSERISQPLENAERAQVELVFGAGTLRVGAQSEPTGLVEGTIAYRDGDRVNQDFHVSGNTAYFGLRSHNDWIGPWDDREARGDDRRWDLRLNPDVPTQLKISGGVGRATLDLSRLKLSDLEVHTGLGKTDITMPGQGRVRATVEGGISRTTILIPRGMAARVQVDRGLTSVDVMGNYQRRGDSYVSPGFDGARDRVDLIVKGGVGKITVQEYGVQ